MKIIFIFSSRKIWIWVSHYLVSTWILSWTILIGTKCHHIYSPLENLYCAEFKSSSVGWHIYQKSSPEESNIIIWGICYIYYPWVETFKYWEEKNIALILTTLPVYFYLSSGEVSKRDKIKKKFKGLVANPLKIEKSTFSFLSYTAYFSVLM